MWSATVELYKHYLLVFIIIACSVWLILSWYEQGRAQDSRFVTEGVE